MFEESVEKLTRALVGYDLESVKEPVNQVVAAKLNRYGQTRTLVQTFTQTVGFTCTMRDNLNLPALPVEDVARQLAEDWIEILKLLIQRPPARGTV